jgi:hypothetical protein
MVREDNLRFADAALSASGDHVQEAHTELVISMLVASR